MFQTTTQTAQLRIQTKAPWYIDTYMFTNYTSITQVTVQNAKRNIIDMVLHQIFIDDDMKVKMYSI